MRVSTHSRVRIEIEINTGSYGPECTMEQIIKQASQEGLSAAIGLAEKAGGRARVVGSPKVVTVTTAPDGGSLDSGTA